MPSNIRKALARREKGQALVELSLCASFLVLVLLAVWQVGTIFSNYIDLSEAARAGARAAAISGAPTASGDTASFTAAQSDGVYAATQSAPNLDATHNLTITITSVTPWQAGARVRATASYPYSLSLFGVAVTSGTMSVSDDMRVHRLAT
jgi:Flp pilus assembly protein TadG